MAEYPICRACWIIRVSAIFKRIGVITVCAMRMETFFIFFIRQIHYMVMSLAYKEESNEWTYHKTQKSQPRYNHVNKKNRAYGHENQGNKKCGDDNIKPIGNTTTIRRVNLSDFNILFFFHGPQFSMIYDYIKKTENKSSHRSKQSELVIPGTKYNANRNTNKHHWPDETNNKHARPVTNATSLWHLDFDCFGRDWFCSNVHEVTPCIFNSCENNYIHLHLYIITEYKFNHHKKPKTEACNG